MGRTLPGLRRRLLVAAVAVTAGALAGVAFLADSDAGTPAPIVWRDHVVETAPGPTAP